jgi:hypothetical protein
MKNYWLDQRKTKEKIKQEAKDVWDNMNRIKLMKNVLTRYGKKK